MIAASQPVRRPASARLVVLDSTGRISDHPRSDLVSLLHPADLVIANDAATLPASLVGTHLPTGRTVEIRLAGRGSLAPDDVHRFAAIVFGSGDFRTRFLPIFHPAIDSNSALSAQRLSGCWAILDWSQYRSTVQRMRFGRESLTTDTPSSILMYPLRSPCGTYGRRLPVRRLHSSRPRQASRWTGDCCNKCGLAVCPLPRSRMLLESPPPGTQNSIGSCRLMSHIAFRSQPHEPSK
jgi:hypothetical protein